MTAPRHGKNALIYVSGTELEGGNAWTLNITLDNVETPQFSETWKNRKPGMLAWDGSINAWEHTDQRLIRAAATSQSAVELLIYPDKETPANYYSGSALFGATSSGGVNAGIADDGTFIGDGTLTENGWS